MVMARRLMDVVCLSTLSEDAQSVTGAQEDLRVGLVGQGREASGITSVGQEGHVVGAVMTAEVAPGQATENGTATATDEGATGTVTVAANAAAPGQGSGVGDNQASEASVTASAGGVLLRHSIAPLRITRCTVPICCFSFAMNAQQVAVASGFGFAYWNLQHETQQAAVADGLGFVGRGCKQCNKTHILKRDFGMLRLKTRGRYAQTKLVRIWALGSAVLQGTLRICMCQAF
jgi:hypothetical protein